MEPLKYREELHKLLEELKTEYDETRERVGSRAEDAEQKPIRNAAPPAASNSRGTP